MSECGNGAPSPSSPPSRPASISRTVFMLGDLDIEWATTPSLQRSTTGERQGLVPPALNSVASV